MLLSDVCLSVAYTGLTREQRGLGQLKFAQRQPTSHVIWTPLSRSKGQLVADVLNSQHAGTGATWRINTKILSTCRGQTRIVSPRAQLVNEQYSWIWASRNTFIAWMMWHFCVKLHFNFNFGRGRNRVAENRGRRPRAGLGILGRGPAPSLPVRVSVERCEPSEVRGGGSTAQRFSTILTTQDGLSWHYNIVNLLLWTIMPPLGARPPSLSYAFITLQSW